MALLEINDLSVTYRSDEAPVKAVDGVTLDLFEGEILGLVGESGSGKTTLGKSINGLLPASSTVEGEILYDGRDISTLSEREIRELRWKEISMIPQSAMNALDPVHKIGKQFREVIRTHSDATRSEADERTRELLERVDLQPQLFHDYAHELSGGQRQRVVIALSLALDPSVVIADEPTTGLDVVVQKNLMNLVSEFQDELDLSVLFITHDISVIAEIADRVAVMYAGQLAEVGETGDVFERSLHPYTIGLRNSYPEIGSADEALISIPGDPPELMSPPTGCRFAPRCPFATDECESEPPLAVHDDGHAAKCHYTDDAAAFRERGQQHETWTGSER